MVNSGIHCVGVITQKNYHSLMDHLGSGKEWDLHRKREGLFIIPPFQTRENTGIYRGSVDAFRAAIGYVKRSPQRYLLLSGSHTIYNMMFSDMLDRHISSGELIKIGKRYDNPWLRITVRTNRNVSKVSLSYSHAYGSGDYMTDYKPTEKNGEYHWYLKYPVSEHGGRVRFTVTVYGTDKSKFSKSFDYNVPVLGH